MIILKHSHNDTDQVQNFGKIFFFFSQNNGLLTNLVILVMNLKVGLLPFKKMFYLLQWKPLKMMKNAFYFILKALFVLKIFRFLSWLFDHVEKTVLIRKIMLISKFMMSQPGQQTITIHTLPYISQSKGNETIKFGQLIEYSRRNIFLQRSYRKWGRKTSSRPLFASGL